MKRISFAVLGLFIVAAAASRGAEGLVERGKESLLGRAINPPVWGWEAYENVWKKWGLQEKPDDFDQRFRDRYGLHPAPYENDGMPMGLRRSSFLFKQTVATDCTMCHGGSILGKSYVGLGNASLDLQTLYEEMNAADGRAAKTPFVFSNVRGTNEAGGMSVFLLAYREPDLTLRRPPLDLGLHDDMCEDVPAWWLLKKKKTMYHTGGASARSVRSLMQFMMHPLNSGQAIKKEEDNFRAIQAYLLSIEAPAYPFPIDQAKADQGQALFTKHCARCHGAYGKNWTYPNRIVPLDVIGTDDTRFKGVEDKFGNYYNKSWFAQENEGWFSTGYKAMPTPGYQAPPLDGVWATAPYLHNGSVPTVYHVLNSKARPDCYTRSFRTGKEDYDPKLLGWKYRVVDAPAKELPGRERRKIYDTKLPGRGNQGHTFGDKLNDPERLALIEYLKTL